MKGPAYRTVWILTDKFNAPVEVFWHEQDAVRALSLKILDGDYGYNINSAQFAV